MRIKAGEMQCAHGMFSRGAEAGKSREACAVLKVQAANAARQITYQF